MVKIQDSANTLANERNQYLNELKDLIEKRKQEKNEGHRTATNGRLKLLCEKRTSQIIPKVGFWGWKKQRQEDRE